MQAQPDALSDRLKPAFTFAALAVVGLLVLYTLAGLLNLLLGRERIVQAQLTSWDVQVGRRGNTVTSTFESNGKSYQWTSNKVAQVEQGKPMELVVDGFLWDEVVEIRQAGKAVWKRL